MNVDDKRLNGAGSMANYAGKARDNWMWLAGLGAVVLVVIVVAMTRWKKTEPNTPDRAEGQDENGQPISIEQHAAELAARYFTQGPNCSIDWVSTGAPTALAGHTAFFRRAVKSTAAMSIETQTDYVFGLLNRGCARPKLLDGFDIDKAIAGNLGLAQTAMWPYVRGDQTVQLYLAVRAMVAAVQAS